METRETEYEQNGEERTANNFIVETMQKTKISPHWRADRSSPE